MLKKSSLSFIFLLFTGILFSQTNIGGDLQMNTKYAKNSIVKSTNAEHKSYSENELIVPEVEAQRRIVTGITVLPEEETNKRTLSSNAIRLYPNPATTEFTITNLKGLVYSLVDNRGRRFARRRSESDNEKINVSRMASGIYFVQIEADDKVIVKKLIIK